MIFTESTTYRPFIYPWAVEAEKKQRIDMYWHEGQIDLQDDLRQYNSKDGLKQRQCLMPRTRRSLTPPAVIYRDGSYCGWRIHRVTALH